MWIDAGNLFQSGLLDVDYGTIHEVRRNPFHGLEIESPSGVASPHA